MAEYIERSKVLAEYDQQHEGAPGRARKIVEDFPAADVVAVGTYCPRCHFATNMKIFKTCPNCGARMDGGVNDATD